MTRQEALTISDALTELGQNHVIAVGVYDNRAPRESYEVSVTPVLSFKPTDISALQRLADKLGYQIGYIDRSFIFTRLGV